MHADQSRTVVMLVRNAFTHDTRVEKEARTLVGAGYAVFVVADAAAGIPRREVRDGTRVIRVLRRLTRIPGLRYIAHELALVRVLRRAAPDVLHAHDSNALLPVALAALALRVPFVYDAHELWLERPPRFRSPPYVWGYRAWYALIQRFVVPRADAVVTVSAPIASHLRRQYRLPQVHLVPNYPEVEPYRRLEIRTLDGAQAVPEHAPIVLHLGGYLPGRGLEELIDAMVDVPDAHLVLLGAGSGGMAASERAGRNRIADRVHSLAAVPSAEVVRYASSATVGVAPIRPTSLNNAYSLPNKLFQYMAAGLPVVASALPQMRDVVESTGAGVTVDTADPRRLAAALNDLLADPHAMIRMGQNARRAVEERFNWSVSARTLLDVYARF